MVCPLTYSRPPAGQRAGFKNLDDLLAATLGQRQVIGWRRWTNQKVDLKVLMPHRATEVKGRSTHSYESLTFAPGIGHPLS